MTQNEWNLHPYLLLISIHGICHPCGTTTSSESFPIHETERFPSLLVKNIKGPSEVMLMYCSANYLGYLQ